MTAIWLFVGLSVVAIAFSIWAVTRDPVVVRPIRPREPPIGSKEWLREPPDPPAAIVWLESSERVEPEGESRGGCQVCGGEMTQNVVRCRKCRTSHHRECWKYVGGCTTFACGETQTVEPFAPVDKVRRPTAPPPRPLSPPRPWPVRPRTDDGSWRDIRFWRTTAERRWSMRNEMSELEQAVLQLASRYGATNVDADGSDNTLGMTFEADGRRYGLSMSLAKGAREAQIIVRLDQPPTTMQLGEARRGGLLSRLRAGLLDDGTLRIRPRGFRWTAASLDQFVEDALELVRRARS